MDKWLLSDKRSMKPMLAKMEIITCFQTGMIVTQAYFLAAAISSLFGGDLFPSAGKQLIIFFLALITRKLLAVWKQHIAFHFAAKSVPLVYAGPYSATWKDCRATR